MSNNNVNTTNIIKKQCENLDELVSSLDKLASNNKFIFRGQNNSKHRLQDSWKRYSITPHEDWMNEFEEMFDKLILGLKRSNLFIPGLSLDSSIEIKLEIARHFGLPSPCIDFSYSPYVAMFFAFNGIDHIEYHKSYKDKKINNSVVYALNIMKLADLWANKCSLNQYNHQEIFDEFLYDRNNEYFHKKLKNGSSENYFPEGLKFIPYSGLDNYRMQKQLGCLLYDTINYSHLNSQGIKDLEDFISMNKVTPCEEEENEPVLYKFYLSHKFTGDVLQKLDLMNINGGMLYNSVSGVVSDCFNSYFYNPIYNIQKK